MSKKTITISLAAKKAGVGIETIRYYQRIGLINEPEKPGSGYRVYPEQTISRLCFIKRAKDLGFSLSEISSLLDLGNGHCKETKELTSHKLQLIKRKVSDLKAMESSLEKLIQSCGDRSPNPVCPIIEEISKQ